MSLSVPTQDAVLNWLRGVPFPATNAMLHLSFHSGEVAATNEVSAQVGGRVPLPPSVLSPPFTGPGGLRMVVNLAELLSGPAQERLTVTELGVWNAETRGSLLFTARAVPELVVEIGAVMSLAPQALQLKAVA